MLVCPVGPGLAGTILLEKEMGEALGGGSSSFVSGD